MGDILAVLDVDERPIGPVGHDLHRRPLAAQHGDAHEFVAHVDEGGRHDGGEAAFEAGGIEQFVVVQHKKAAG